MSLETAVCAGTEHINIYSFIMDVECGEVDTTVYEGALIRRTLPPCSSSLSRLNAGVAITTSVCFALSKADHWTCASCYCCVYVVTLVYCEAKLPNNSVYSVMISATTN